MNTAYILVVGVIVVCHVTQTGAIFCYQCSDAADNEYSDCIRGTHALSMERSSHDKNNISIHKFPHLKDCGPYVDPITGLPKYRFCKIEQISAHGGVNAFIRDCSTGEDFSRDLDTSRLVFNKYLFADNQSTCGYSHRHLANICVQVCDTDFCNGPLAGQPMLTYSKTLTGLWIMILTFRSMLIY